MCRFMRLVTGPLEPVCCVLTCRLAWVHRRPLVTYMLGCAVTSLAVVAGVVPPLASPSLLPRSLWSDVSLTIAVGAGLFQLIVLGAHYLDGAALSAPLSSSTVPPKRWTVSTAFVVCFWAFVCVSWVLGRHGVLVRSRWGGAVGVWVLRCAFSAVSSLGLAISARIMFHRRFAPPDVRGVDRSWVGRLARFQ